LASACRHPTRSLKLAGKQASQSEIPFMPVLEICFWLGCACVLHTYLAYPLILAVLAKLFGRATRRGSDGPRSISFVLCAHNEEASIERRLKELTGMIADSGLHGEVIVVSDGSTDRTAELAGRFADAGVRVLELPHNTGKASALTQGCALAQNELLVFADTRQKWEEGTLLRLVENFADPAVGAVSGDLVIETPEGVMQGFGRYWRFEKWLRNKECLIHSAVGVTGAVSAVRRELFKPIPRGTILDDVYWPLRVAMQGYRVVHDRRAVVHDRLPPRTKDEFRRKVRTLAGNFQLVSRLPLALVPVCNPIWFEFLSHKVCRLLAPWAMLLMLGTSAVLPGTFYGVLFGLQVGCYLVAVAGLHPWLAARSRLASSAATFLVLNTAAWLAFGVWISGKANKSWRKVSYKFAPPAKAPSLSR
jgi:cellulose synthase/poly-beta-1,6-N-acetylglucosamine synthase-like glycosyltransferase